MKEECLFSILTTRVSSNSLAFTNYHKLWSNVHLLLDLVLVSFCCNATSNRVEISASWVFISPQFTPWLTAIGYSLCYGTILVKMMRVWYIFNNPRITTKYVSGPCMQFFSMLYTSNNTLSNLSACYVYCDTCSNSMTGCWPWLCWSSW